MEKIIFYRINAKDLSLFNIHIDRLTFKNIEDAIYEVRESWEKFTKKLRELEGSEIIWEVKEVSTALGYHWQVVRRYKHFCAVYDVRIERGTFILK